VVKIPIPSKRVIAKKSRMFFDKGRYSFFESPGKQFNRIAAGAVAALLIIFMAVLCTGPESVEITVKRLPDDGVIYFDNMEIDDNPFYVDKDDKSSELRIEVDDKVKMKIYLIPSQDKIVVYSPFHKPLVIKKRHVEKSEKTVDKTADDSHDNSSASSDESSDDENESSETSGESSSKRRSSKRKKPFTRLGNRLRRAFNK
jgi:hypothetical protein